MMSVIDVLKAERAKILDKDILAPEDYKALDFIEHNIEKYEPSPDDYFDREKFIPQKLGEEMMKNNAFKTIMGSDEIYYYKDGLYINRGKEIIRETCTKLLKERFKMGYINEVIAYIQALTFIDPNCINDGWMNLENGLLNPQTGEFKKHTPEVFSITRIPICYDPQATCPLWESTLRDRVDENIYMTVQEMFGYCLMPGQKYEKAFLLYGPKRTFKSTCLAMLENILGKENLIAFSLQQINDDSFAAAYMYGKHANICADITSKSLNDTGRFLTITGGDPITASKKNKDHVTFYPSTKLIFSCNVIPATRNKNPAFYRRWEILPFLKQIPLEQINHSFKNKLKDELPGILNWAIEGLKRLEGQDRFSYALSEDEVKDLYEKSSDTVQSFIYNCIDTEDDSSVITKREIFDRYKEWCAENELQPENAIYFGRMFIALSGCGTARKGPKGEQIPAYSGVNWKSTTNKRTDLGDFNDDN